MLPHPAIAIVMMRSCDPYVACGCCIQNGELHSSNCFLRAFLVTSFGGVHVSRMLRCCVVISLRCIYVGCVHNGWCCSCTCLPALSVVVFVFFSHGPSCVVLFALVCLACPLSLFSLPVSFSFSASLSLLASAVEMGLIYLRETHGLRP